MLSDDSQYLFCFTLNAVSMAIQQTTAQSYLITHNMWHILIEWSPSFLVFYRGFHATIAGCIL
jgi:hypothetical protein